MPPFHLQPIEVSDAIFSIGLHSGCLATERTLRMTSQLQMTLCQVHTALPIGNPAFGHFNFPLVENDIQSQEHAGKSYLNEIRNMNSFLRNISYIDGLFLWSKRFAHFIDGWLQAFVIESEMRSFLIWSGNMFLFHVRSLYFSDASLNWNDSFPIERGGK